MEGRVVCLWRAGKIFVGFDLGKLSGHEYEIEDNNRDSPTSPVQNFSCPTIPLPSWITTIGSAGTCSTICCAPPCHCGVMRVASRARPRPKGNRKSLCEQKLPPQRNS